MDLFKPVVAEDRLHPHFKTTLAPFMAAARAVLTEWAAGFPDRDGKLVKEFQTTFNSSFWEIYLFALFKEYGFDLDWSHASPDFLTEKKGEKFVVEATTANAADGKRNEWELDAKSLAKGYPYHFGALNKEAMIRLSNALYSKLVKYRSKYSKLDHVKGLPFVIAVAPFEQPLFQLQYDRAIRAVLYDYYIDEDAYHATPHLYKNGPPGIRLGFVQKENGNDIPLGIFNSDEWTEVSAIIFSCTATWGKVSANANDLKNKGFVTTSHGGDPEGRPYRRQTDIAKYRESVSAGLQIYHNPFARRPLNPSIFRKEGVVQHFRDQKTGEWVYEEIDNCLHSRIVMNIYSDENPALQST